MAKTTTAYRGAANAEAVLAKARAKKPATKAGGARAGAGRKGGQPLPERWREKIRQSGIMERMVRIAKGELEDDPKVLAVQTRTGMALLNKVLPDLTRQELVGENGGPLEIITRAE
jgi:hypothetical protein